RENAKLESADLIEPVESGVLDWLEVHELQEVVAGDVAGRQSDEDIVIFKSNGLAAWDIAAAAAVGAKLEARCPVASVSLPVRTTRSRSPLSRTVSSTLRSRSSRFCTTSRS